MADMKLVSHLYGKAHVRVMKIFRKGGEHSIKELDVQVMLQGEFESSYTRGDNSLVVATDSMKNTVNIFAKEKLGPENELFGVALAEHFLATYLQVHRVEISISERSWLRMQFDCKPHRHSFTEGSAARRIAKVVATKKGTKVESGIEDLLILKSTDSSFTSFVRDKFTTLPETNDRIFATTLRAVWQYEDQPFSYLATNDRILESMLLTFAENFSPSVQTTLFQMGEEALKSTPEISSVNIQMPNKHCLLVNLAPFGMENKNEIFVPTDEPHGQIEATITR